MNYSDRFDTPDRESTTIARARLRPHFSRSEGFNALPFITYTYSYILILCQIEA